MSEWSIETSRFSEFTVNPLRTLWELNQPTPNPQKSQIILQIGDPTVFGNLPQHPICVESIQEAVLKDTFSYGSCAGEEKARQAVADYSQHMGNITSKDVILTSGCSMALEMSFQALANPGDNILIPRPCWNYVTWILGLGIETQFYNLDPKKGWNVDLEHMESLINDRTKAILVNSPGNPCGNVFSKEHLLEIIEVAERHKLPIISDEVYEFFVFPGVKHHSMASLSKNVPIMTCSGLTKRFLLPGIRMGWLILNDRGDKLKNVRKGLINVSGRNFGPNSTIQRALPKILKSVPQLFFNETCETVGVNILPKMP
jgi:tyrosine aminotransferase